MERHNKLEEMSKEEKIAFEKYVKDIEKRLLEFNEADWVPGIMTGYANDFLDFWKDDWNLNAVATGIEMGYL